jgi:pilus assembly protein FimV
VGSVLKSLVKITGLIAGLVLSGAVYALGMGGINVTSALGQPLSAEIDLISVSKSDEVSLSAKLASPDTFQMAGVDYPYSLPRIKFRIETRKDGTSYIKLTTDDPINDPFVNLLVELDWATGKLMREYTFLLDPPGYTLEQPKPEPVQPVEPTATERQWQKEWAAQAKTESQPMPAASPVKEQTLPAAKQPAKTAIAGKGQVATGTITVKHGDTLTRIAEQIKEPDVTLEQMLVALYRANADQFDGKNMNRIRAGKILRRPTDSDFAHLSNTEAVKVIHAQAADWHAYRQKLAAASSTVSEQAPQQEVSGKISTSVSDKTPAAKSSAKEVLRLSKGEAPGDKVAASGNKVQSMQDKIHSLEEEAVARNKELQDSKQRIAMLEKNIKDMQHLVDLKAQPVPTETPAEVKHTEPAKIVPPPAAKAASAVAAASAVQAVKPAEKPKPVVKPKHKAAPKLVPPPPPPSMLDEIIGNPLYLGGLAAAVLALGGLGFFAVRRRGTGGKKKDIQSALAEQAEEGAGHIPEPAMPSPDTGDFTHMGGREEAADEESRSGEEEVDPISEAELFLNFGRYAQAEEVLKEALGKDPNNLKYLIKLLGIYASEKDVNAFSSFARRVQDSGDVEAWEKVSAMGRDIDPGNPMYGGTGESGETGAMEEAASEESAGKAGSVTDFLLDEGKNEAPAALDFDLGMGTSEIASQETTEGSETTTILSQTEMRAAQEAPMDFDITSTNPSMSAAKSEAATAKAPENVDLGLDFDITSTNPSMPAAEPEASSAIDITAENEPSGGGLNLDDLIFDVTGTSPAAEETVEAESAPAEKASAPMDIGLGDINLNLNVGEPEQSASTEAPAGDKDEHWHEVATKLDLAKAYQEMGDADGAREILQEVVRDGDDQQREAAKALIDQLPA